LRTQCLPEMAANMAPAEGAGAAKLYRKMSPAMLTT
jgi:hypothetical protein